MSCASGSSSGMASALGVPLPVLVFIADVPDKPGDNMFASGVETGVKREECGLNDCGEMAGSVGMRDSAGVVSAIRMVRFIPLFRIMLDDCDNGPLCVFGVCCCVDSVARDTHTFIRVSRYVEREEELLWGRTHNQARQCLPSPPP